MIISVRFINIKNYQKYFYLEFKIYRYENSYIHLNNQVNARI